MLTVCAAAAFRAAAAMGGYITAIWGWDEQVQRDFHARAFNPGRWQIITADGADAGTVDIEYRPAEIYLSRVEICPRYQGHGIGARLISAHRQPPRPGSFLEAASVRQSQHLIRGIAPIRSCWQMS
jgi:GNAT superfamily N-acetyltransferase